MRRAVCPAMQHRRLLIAACLAAAVTVAAVYGVGTEPPPLGGRCELAGLTDAAGCPASAPRLLTPAEQTGRAPALLWSFPGSGNSFLRMLVEQGSGYATGSVYHTDPVMNKVFVGEQTCGRDVIAVKAHEKIPSRCAAAALYPREVVLVRHPVKALFAEYNRKFARGGNRHVLSVARHEFSAANFTAVMEDMARQWAAQHLARLGRGGRAQLVVYFEDLVAKGAEDALLRVLRFLGVCAPSRAAARCAVAHGEHPLLRRIRREGDVTIDGAVTPDVLDRVWAILGNVAERHGYEKDAWTSRRATRSD
eukprot:TRINITY_DN12276_c1_g1_i1.p1 TRINITY_DN12276_c1_g1~~TRINITY_DN12276_c1_g1_i1.p1  ORF type:complete len:307 (+),score=75.10 TRINITY_DN12276_c1_g1_i1:94-1014(+)